MSDKVRLLLVDDSALVRDLLFRSISAFDSSIEVVGVAVNGRDGLEKLAALKPDVVVTDMDMPVMNGLEFIRQAMMQRPLPIIVLSSWTQNDKSITLQALETGAVDYISKPSALNPQGFDETLRQLVMKIKSAARITSAIPRKTSTAQPFTNASAPSVPTPKSVAGQSQGMPAVPRTVTAAPFQTPNYEERIGQMILGVGEIGVSNESGKRIKTFALGSCVALNLFSETLEMVGMAHIALATSTTSPEKARLLPGYFADTAVPALISQLRGIGYRKPTSQLVAKIAGGAQTSADANNYFKIGEKNIAAVKALLSSLGITLLAEDIGESLSRTVCIQVGSKAVQLSSPERVPWVI
ncbi:MAG: response regulator [Ignavibacteria bacterium]|nr:response regulator [Ignavibacteria bacterium]